MIIWSQHSNKNEITFVFSSIFLTLVVIKILKKMNEQIINKFEDKNVSSGLVTIAHTNFFCYNNVQGSLTAGYLYSNIGATNSNIEVYMRYHSGDITEYTLLYQIDDGPTESFTFTPGTSVFTKSSSFTSLKCWLMVPYQGGNPNTSCSMSVFK